MNCLGKHLAKLKPLRVLLLGDFMLDEYISGPVERISPEAPVPVIRIDKIEFRPGGAGNAALCFAELGASVFCCGPIGASQHGKILCKKLEKSPNIHVANLQTYSNVETIVKTRIIGEVHRNKRQQLLRMDLEPKKLPTTALPNLELFDFVAISDYGKGSINEEVMNRIRKSKKPFVVDPNRNQNPRIYAYASLVTPNRQETNFGELSGSEDEQFIKARDLNIGFLAQNLIITLDSDGCYAYNGRIQSYIPALSQEIYDVTGAGDVFFAVASLAFMSGIDLVSAAQLANVAAGLKVRKFGAGPITLSELTDYVRNLNVQTK